MGQLGEGSKGKGRGAAGPLPSPVPLSGAAHASYVIIYRINKENKKERIVCNT